MTVPEIHKNRRILITGATGITGSVITRMLVRQGYTNILALHRTPLKDHLLQDVNADITFQSFDLLDYELIESIVQPGDVIIHTAAHVGVGDEDVDYMMRINVEGTRHLVNAALVKDAAYLIHISSIAAIGRSDTTIMINEEKEWIDSKKNTPYAVSKHLSELEVFRGLAEGLPIAVLNPGVILAAGYWQQSSARIIDMVSHGLRFYTKGCNGFVDVRDIGAAVIVLLKNRYVGERFILVGHNVKYKELLTSIALALGKKPPSITVKSWMIWPLRLTKWLLPWNKTLNAISLDYIKTASLDITYDSDKSVQMLGIDYTPIKQSIEDIASVYIEGQLYGVMPLDHNRPKETAAT